MFNHQQQKPAQVTCRLPELGGRSSSLLASSLASPRTAPLQRLGPRSPRVTDQCIMTESIMSKAATMEIPINSNGDTGTLTEDDSLEQAANLQWSLDEKVGSSRGTRDLQQVMVSGPNLNETSIVSGGYGGTAEGIIPTSSIKGPAVHYNAEFNKRIPVEGLGSSIDTYNAELTSKM
ncbi:unnamed protein product [Pleuronectes platessa]|uniref:Uncharacterized protein n=1 Tax=Pleuronectes platessa TaxID=8262 RepID=A0A9N7W150_PLEPL|nr:unnamed protein product [Pleuronectes platessa]